MGAVEATVIITLDYMARRRGEANFTFTKAEFIKTYYFLVRHGKITRHKVESILRALRLLASRGFGVKYLDRSKGVYLCDPVELHVLVERCGLKPIME